MLALTHWHVPFSSHLRLAVLLTPTVVLAHAALIDAGWGYVMSWVNEVVKQDRLSRQWNTLIADVVLVVTAFVRALMQVPHGQTWPSWSSFATSLFFVALPALANVHGFLTPTGIGPKIQTATSLSPAGPAVGH